jgi:hypothetical protein
VERELKDDLAPPGAYITVLIGQRPLKLAQPAMRGTRVTLDAKRKLVITSVAFQGGGEKTDTTQLSAEEAVFVRGSKSVLFALGGQRWATESIPVVEVTISP